MSVVRVCIVKLGNIGSAPLLELLLDERADRSDIDVRVISSGAKLNPEQAEDIAEKVFDFKPDLVLVVSPNAALPGPSKIREVMAKAGVPTIVVTDAPGKRAKDDIEGKGQGYIVVNADAMIGARREFLDPVEMAIFNADVIKVLAITGAFTVICREIDKVIEAIKKGVTPELPRIVVDKNVAVEAAGFNNPYAKAKAIAAYEAASKVAELNVEGCFKISDFEKYIPIVAAAHELMRQAALLADEARELEKSGDTVLRMPHKKSGELVSKRKLMEKPS
ncbi:MAG: F420-dependent methylenetetrahydromethanopterin dehydrogenase [Candidatus Freyarchaeota archaeon]|nr:F420-dependent methylenetetrahydromethanopterin dehydrogenase [Candidatus Jordarchaeia archaeon]